MNKIISLALFLLCVVGFAQNKKITLEDIWINGKIYPKRMNQIHSMKDGQYFIRVKNQKKASSLEKYSYLTQKKVSQIFSTKNIPELSQINFYEFSNNEKKLLLAEELKPIYRHSKKGKYYVYDLKSKSVKLLYDDFVQEPTFSPDSKKVSYVFENNIYVKDLEKDKVIQITEDGIINKTINGITDWVYEEEFAFVRAYQWNPSGSYIAFLKFDEKNVPDFSMNVYGASLYPSIQTFKYPKAGEKNSKVSLHVYNLDKEVTLKVPLNTYYIPRIKWTNDDNILSIQTLNRHQNNLKLIFYNVKSKKNKVILEEKDKAYLDITDDLKFLEKNKFLWTSDQDGYRHVYLYSSKGKLINQVTKGPWEVTKLYGYSDKQGMLYYQSTERGSVYRDVYLTTLDRKKKRLLTKNRGTHNAIFSADMSYYIDEFSNWQVPPKFILYKAPTGEKVKSLITNKSYLEEIKKYDLPKKEFLTLKVNEDEVNVWIIKPTKFNPSKKYPLFITQYSGPGSQMVANRWFGANDFWYMMLAQMGYYVVCMDGRGTGFKGSEFKKITYKQLGKYEVEDQIELAKQLGSRSYIDKNRIGIWGWSYGGFMSSNCILKGADIFKMAIAVAPVTSWRFYDTVYTERYMQTPQENAQGYDENSPLNYVDKLKGKYLLIHGTSDDNVHVQNSMRMIDALIQADKQFDWAIYPDKNHRIYGGNTRLHLYKKMTDFIENNL